MKQTKRAFHISLLSHHVSAVSTWNLGVICDVKYKLTAYLSIFALQGLSSRFTGSLHWLHLHCVIFKICTISYQALSCKQPSYIHSLVTLV